MNLWITLTVNSLAIGGVLFLLSAGFSLIFGLMRIPNMLHGSLFMLGGYFGVSLLSRQLNFWLVALVSAAGVALLGGLVERLLLRRLQGKELPQILLTLGLSFVVADVCLLTWSGDPWQPALPAGLQGAVELASTPFPTYRLAIVALAMAVAVGLWWLVERTRLGAMIRAGVDDAPMAGVVGIHVSRLFTLVFALGAGLAGFGGVIAAPFLSVYPGLDHEMLPLALIVVIIGGAGSLAGAMVSSFLIGFIYNFGKVMLPDMASVLLFVPMLIVLLVRPQGLFGRSTA